MHVSGTLDSAALSGAVLSASPGFRQKAGGQLVIVQGNALTRSALARFFASTFNVAAFVAPAPAEDFVRTVSQSIYVLAGQLFPGPKPGPDWIQRWRRQYPQVHRAVLTTGLDDTPQHLEGIDLVISKPFNVQALAHWFSRNEAAFSGPQPIHQRRIPA